MRIYGTWALSVGLAILSAPALAAYEESDVYGFEYFDGSPTAKALLLEQGFVVTDKTDDMYDFYVDRYAEPAFITTDAIFFAYNVTLERAYASMEARHADALAALLPFIRDAVHDVRAGKSAEEIALEAREHGDTVEEYAAHPYQMSLEPLVEAGRLDADWLTAADAADDYLAVAEALLSGKTSPGELKDAPAPVREEVALILEAEGPAASPLRGVTLDYSRFQPYGFYPGDVKLERYFRALTWLREVPFRVADENEAKQALLLGKATYPSYVFDADVEKFHVTTTLWGITQAYEEFFGPSGDLAFGPDVYFSNIYTNCRLMNHYDLEENRAEWAEAWNRMKRLRITPEGVTFEPPAEPGEFHLVPRPKRYDDVVLSPLTPGGKTRPLFTGEELMAAMGSAAAAEVVAAREGKVIPGYADMLEEARTAAAEADKEYHGYICGKLRDVYRTLLEPPTDESLPPYVRHPNWRYKNLNTCLASWAHGRFIWDAYGKSEIWAFAGWEEFPTPDVEPNLPFYEALLRLAVSSDDYFRRHGVPENGFCNLSAFLVELIPITKKQLAGEELTYDEYMTLYFFPAVLRDPFYEGGGTGGVAFWPREDERFRGTESCVPVAADRDADVTRVVGQAMPRTLYVILEEKGRGKFLASGGVLSYRDILGPASGPDRMTLDKWRNESAASRAPAPAWQRTFAVDFTREELLADLRKGIIRKVTLENPDPAMADIIADRLSRGEKFDPWLSDRGEQNPGDYVLRLFKATAPPQRVVDVVFPLMEKAPSEYEWYTVTIQAMAAALDGLLSDRHVDVMTAWLRDGHPHPDVLLGSIGTVPGPRAEAALFSYLDENAAKVDGEFEPYYVSPYFNYRGACWQAALDELTARADLDVDRQLLERLSVYRGWAYKQLAVTMVRKWSETYVDVSTPDEVVKPRAYKFTPEEREFVDALKRKLGAELYEDYSKYRRSGAGGPGPPQERGDDKTK